MVKSGDLEANCHMERLVNEKCPCPKCDKSCAYTVYEDYKCQGHRNEKVIHNDETILVTANKSGSVKIHGKGCEITFYENHDKSGKKTTYSSDTDGIRDLGKCDYCVIYACDYLKDDDETLVSTKRSSHCEMSPR